MVDMEFGKEMLREEDYSTSLMKRSCTSNTWLEKKKQRKIT